MGDADNEWMGMWKIKDGEEMGRVEPFSGAKLFNETIAVDQKSVWMGAMGNMATLHIMHNTRRNRA